MSSKLPSLTTLLFGDAPKTQRGRKVNFGDDVMDKFKRGSFEERIIDYLSYNREGVTARDIAEAIGTQPSRVNGTLIKLKGEEIIDQIKDSKRPSAWKLSAIYDHYVSKKQNQTPD